MISKTIFWSALFFLYLLGYSVAHGQQSPFNQPSGSLPAADPVGRLQFEHNRLDFAPQSVGVENCSNVALQNFTDHPRLLTDLYLLDDKHFSISAPSHAMLPLTLGGNSSLYLSLCYKTDRVGPNLTYLVAVFQSDTTRLLLSGRGVRELTSGGDSKVTSLAVKKSRSKWTFSLQLAERSIVKLELVNALGETVRGFPFNEIKAPGTYEVAWDGKKENGKRMEPGTYYLRMEATQLDTRDKVHSSQTIRIK